MKKIILLFIISIMICLSSFAQTPGSGYTLSFDGANDYANLGNTIGGQLKTIEFWFSPSSNIDNINTNVMGLFVRNDASQSDEIQVYISGWAPDQGKLIFGRHSTSSGSVTVKSDNSTWLAGKWYHVAGIFDPIGGMQLYINGKKQLSTNSHTGSPGARPEISSIGRWGDLAIRHFNGNIDEVKIWSKALTQIEIQDWMCKKVNSTHPSYSNLVSYYKFDVGNGSILTDSIGSNDGTLINAPAWQLSRAPIGNESAHVYGNATSVTQVHSDGSNFTIDNFTGTPDGAHVYIVNEAPNANTETLSGALEETRYYGTFVVNGTSPTYSATYNYSGNSNIEGIGSESETRLTKRDDNSITNWTLSSNSFDLNQSANVISICNESSRGEYCGGFDDVEFIKRPGSGYALGFDGSNDLVDVGTLPSNIWNSDFTIETYAKFNNFSNFGGIFSNFSTTNGGVAIHQQTTGEVSFIVGINSSGGNYDQVSSTALQSGLWYHIAAVKRGSDIEIYINGILNSTTTSSRTVPNNQIYIGRRYMNNPSWVHNGNIDEIRIWSTALSQVEIRDWMCKKVTSSHPQYCNLVSYYRFDNASGTVLTNYAGSNDGTLINSPSWQLSGAPVGDESTYQYSNTPNVSLSHPDGDNLTINTFTGSPTAAHVYVVNEYPNTLAGTQGVGINDKYFGVFKIGDNSATYTVNYDYTGNPGVGVNEPDLELYKRNDNATILWTNTTATLNTITNTLITTGQSTEYILGSSGIPLPVQLVSFRANCNQDKVDITWSTQTEINNDYFVVEKSNDAIHFMELTKTDGAGNSNVINNYDVTDDNANTNVVYYRLKQVDFDGTTAYHQIVSVNCIENKNQVSIYPNPNKGIVNIDLGSLKAVDIKVYNINGKLVHEEENIITPTYQFEITTAKGIYFVELSLADDVKRFKVIKD